MLLANMSKKQSAASGNRKRSDAGKVFPSGVQIRKTAYGLGVFAFAFIPKGTPIARIAGKIIHEAGYSSDYCIDAGNDKVLEPEPPFCYLNHACEPNCMLAHYVTESDVSETEDIETGELTEDDLDLSCECCGAALDDDSIYGGDEDDFETGEEVYEAEEDDPTFEEDADAEIWVESLTDIMPNEELTIDYCWPADRAAKCLCGKAACRGWIVDPAERKLLPQ